MVAITILFDLIAVVAFGTTAVVAGLNYRDFDLEAGFWSNVAFGSLLGGMWTAVVFAEWIGISGNFWELLSLILLSITTGVFAITATGSLSSVVELKSEVSRPNSVDGRPSGPKRTQKSVRRRPETPAKRPIRRDRRPSRRDRRPRR